MRLDLLLTSIPELNPNSEHCLDKEHEEEIEVFDLKSDPSDTMIGQWTARPRADLPLDQTEWVKPAGAQGEPEAGRDGAGVRLHLLVMSVAAVATGIGLGYLYALLIG